MHRINGWMLPLVALLACDPASEDDTYTDQFPGLTDSTTTDESGVTDEVDETDADGDGVPESLDCNDNDADTFPGAPELCDGEDNDCNDQIDDGLPETEYFLDADGDSIGATQSFTTCESTPPQGYVEATGDCDDTNDQVAPGLPELCDGLDNDCNQAIDDGIFVDYYRDVDGDQFGDSTDISSTCDGTVPAGYVVDATDCDDTNPLAHPGAAPSDSTTDCMLDSDGDGFGDDQPAPGIQPGTDCADNSATAFPGAAPNDSLTDCMNDADGDGWGDQSVGAWQIGSDCDDTAGAIYPGAVEICDTIDNNCVDGIDGADPSLVGDVTAHYDLDSDGYYSDQGVELCGVLPTGTIGTPGGDCDDTDLTVHPGIRYDVCDGIDRNCTGAWDFDYSIPTDFSTVSDAIAGTPGTTDLKLCLEAGTHDSIVLQDPITRIGGEGPSTVIEPISQSVAITASGLTSPLTIANLSIWAFDDSSVSKFNPDPRGILIDNGVETRIQDVEIDNMECDQVFAGMSDGGCAVSLKNTSSVSLENLLITDTSTYELGDLTGGVIYSDGVDLTLRNVAVINSTAQSFDENIDGAVLYAVGGSLDAENLLIGNSSSYAENQVRGVVYAEGTASLRQVTIHDNYTSAQQRRGRAVHFHDTVSTEIHNTAFSRFTSNDEVQQLGESIIAYTGTTGGTHSLRYINFYGNYGTPDSTGEPLGTLIEGWLYADPLFANWVWRTSDMEPTADSGLIDAGDPAVLDTDGSRSDLGAFGGPNATGW